MPCMAVGLRRVRPILAGCSQNETGCVKIRELKDQAAHASSVYTGSTED